MFKILFYSAIATLVSKFAEYTNNDKLGQLSLPYMMVRKIGYWYLNQNKVYLYRNYIITRSLCLGKFLHYKISREKLEPELDLNITCLYTAKWYIMTDSVMTTSPGKSGIRLKREI